MAVGGQRWTVYLGGEIHSDWRDRIAAGVREHGLEVDLVSPVTDHDASDRCGAAVFGDEDDPFWFDHKGGKLNSVRTRTLIRRADAVVIRFAGEYREWNAAFDAGYASALGKPLITVHGPELRHALKEVDAWAQGVAEKPEQVVAALRYVLRGELD